LSSLLYRAEKGWLGREHPLTKLYLVLWAVSLILIVPAPASALLAVLVGALGLSLDSSTSWLRRWLLTLAPLAISLFIIHAFFLHAPDLKWAALVPVSRQGLVEAASLIARIGFALGVFLLFLSTTHPSALLKALDAKRVSPGLSYLLASPLLLIDLFAERAKSIQDAQQTRGLSLDQSALSRLLALPALLVPLVTLGLLDNQSRSAALTGRAFRALPYRTVLNPPPDQAYGPALRAILLAATALQGGLAIWLYWK
jgi:energy-coupling factor transport system permease protein